MRNLIKSALFGAVAAVLLQFSPVFAGPLPQLGGHAPLVLGHRGASGYMPEHSRGAYETAINMGADFIEPDLVPTKDGHLVARHENEIGRTTNVSEKFPDRKTKKSIDGAEIEGWFTEDFTLAELKTLRVKASADFPFRSQAWNGVFEILTLQEVIDIAKTKGAEVGRTIGVYPETKHPTYFRSIGLPLEDRLIEILAKNGLEKADSPVFIQSFELSSLATMRPHTKARMVYLMTEGKRRPFDHVVKQDPRTYGDMMKPAALAEIAKIAQAIGPWKRSILVETNGQLSAPTSLVKDAHAAGMLVHIYTLRDEPRYLNAAYEMDPINEYLAFFKLGVDGVFTDFPDTAFRARALYMKQMAN